MNREAFIEVIGKFPAKVPLNAKTLESIDCGSYIREKVEYATESDDSVRAYLLIPKRLSGKVPAVFCHHQHDGNFELGKSEVVGLAGDPNQKYAAELAERGYITFAPDAVAFEERNWGENSDRAEYFELASRLVKGNTLLAKVLHDVSAGLDFIESREEIDRDHIGFIGHSYGGRMAIWAPAFDKRIKVSVSNCGCVNYKNSLTHDAGIQMEFCVPNIMNIGDVEDIVRMVAPTPFFISAAENDKWSRGAREIYAYAQSAFPKGCLKLKIWPGDHVFVKEMREEAYAFLDQYLLHK